MRIKEITWKNYRQYRDQHIVFNKNGKNDLHYFIAENGIGKTTFFNSVNWCLYNDEPYLTDKDKAFSILSKSVKKDMKTGDIRTVSVEIIVECDQGNIKYIRESDMRKTENNELSEVDCRQKVVTVFKGEESHTYQGDEAITYVNRFVPEKLRDYYFFDAESLKDYFTSESNEKVKKAVFEISDIDTLKTMQSNLEEVAKKYRKEVTKNNPETSKLNQELERLIDLKTDKENLKETTQNEYETAEKEFDRYKRILDSNENSEEIEARRDELAKKIDEYENKELNLRMDIRNFVKRYSILLNTYPQMKKLFSKLNEMDTNDELPPKITKDYLIEMLGKNKCLICDRDLDDDAYAHINMLLDRHRSKETLQELNSVRGNLQSLMNEASRYKEKRDELLQHWKEIKDALNDFVNEKTKIDLKYDQIPDLDKLKHAAQMRFKYENEKEKKREDIINLKRDIQEISEKIEKLKENIKEEIEKEGKKEKAQYSLDLTTRGNNVLSQIIEEIRDEIRDKISEKTGELFLDLIWKKVTYATVGLTDDYAISARDADGEEGVGSTSGAEGQLLALSFILALQSVSGYDSPLIIDTPVARTSGPLRTNFCEALKTVSENKQVILFFTEDEFNSRVKDAIQGYESNHYALSLIDENYIDVR